MRANPRLCSSYNDEIKQGLDHYCPEHQCDTLPSLLRGPAPVYPPAQLAEGISGQATIIFNIDTDGRTVDLKLESASRPAFAKAAMAALKQWQFKPATLNGKPVKISCQQEFPFRARYGPSD